MLQDEVTSDCPIACEEGMHSEIVALSADACTSPPLAAVRNECTFVLDCTFVFKYTSVFDRASEVALHFRTASVILRCVTQIIPPNCGGIYI